MGAHRSYRDRKLAFARQLLALRTQTSLTQSGLAEQIGVHLRSVQNWEAGVSYPKAETLQRLIAVLFSQHAFTQAAERAEAHALWTLAAEDGPHMLAAFDEVWFARMLAPKGTMNDAGGTLNEERQSAALIVHPSSFVDWGEATAVPTLYGRDRELATLQQWAVDDRCRVIALVALGGMGKSSLAITFAQRAVSQFDVVLFRSLQNGPPLADLLDQLIRAISEQSATLPERVSDKIARLVQLFREQRCLLILDNFESILQPGTLTGTYRTGYAEYGILLQGLSARDHQSCLLLTSREKPAELGAFEGRATPVRSLNLTGLGDDASGIILASKDIVGPVTKVRALVRLYGGNPLALHLVAEPIRELFGGDVSAFLAAGDAFFNGVGKLLTQQFARSTPLEQAVLYWLAIERELVPLSALLLNLGDIVSQRELLAALESLRHRMMIERGPGQPAFTLQPVILEYVTDQLVETACQEIVAEQPQLLLRHALIQATSREYIRRSQERLIATPVLERLDGTYGSAEAVEQRLLALLIAWREQPEAQQGYGPGNVINLLRLLRGNLRGLDLTRLAIRQAYLQGVELQDARLSGTALRDTLFTETFDAMTAVAISSSGNYWAAASRRGEVLVWEAASLILHRMWRAHTDMIWTLTFSPDGRMLASGSWDGAVRLWDAANGTLLWAGRHTSHVNRVLFAPDGRMLASSGNDGTLRIWDVQSGTELQTLSHPSPLPVAAWSPDGRLLASGDVAGTIRLWELQLAGPAMCVQTLEGHTTWVDGLDFSPDGRTLASASWDSTVKLWDVPSGRLRETLIGHTDRALRLIWSPDGRTLFSGSRDRTILLWDVATGSYRAALRGHTAGVNGLALHADGSRLLSGSEDGTLRVWDLASEQCVRVIQGYAASLYDVDWSPDGMQLAACGTDHLVTIYAATSGSTAPRMLPGHIGVVFGVGWSADGRLLASSEWDNIIRLWDPISGACLRVLQHPDDPGNYFYGLAWSPDGQRLACGTYRRGVQVFEMQASRERWQAREFPTWIRHVAWKPDGTQVAGGGDDGTVYVWDAADGALLHQLVGHHSMITRMAWSPDGMRLASGSGGSAGGDLFMWDAQTGELLRIFAGHPEIVSAIAWDAARDLLISGSGDGKLRWWDTQTGACVRTNDAHRGTVQSLRRSPDGTKLASCGDDGAIMLWDMFSGAYLQTVRRDRPYERLNIAGISGVTAAQRLSLLALGAVE